MTHGAEPAGQPGPRPVVVIGVTLLAAVVVVVLALAVAGSPPAPGTGAGTPVTSVTPTGSIFVPSGDNRVGGSPPGPAPARPGWAWWGAGALLAAFAAGGFRLWRNRDFLAADDTVDEDVEEDLDDAYGNGSDNAGQHRSHDY